MDATPTHPISIKKHLELSRAAKIASGEEQKEDEDAATGVNSDRNDTIHPGAAACSNPDCARYLSAAQEIIGELENDIERLKEEAAATIEQKDREIEQLRAEVSRATSPRRENN